MSADHVQLEGPDLSLGVQVSAIPDGAMLSGHVGNRRCSLPGAAMIFSRSVPHAPIMERRSQKG